MWATFRMRLVSDDLFPVDAARGRYVTVGQGWLKAPVLLRARAMRREEDLDRADAEAAASLKRRRVE